MCHESTRNGSVRKLALHLNVKGKYQLFDRALVDELNEMTLRCVERIAFLREDTQCVEPWRAVNLR